MGSVVVRFEAVLEAFAVQDGCQLLAAGVHDGGHVRVFVSVLPKVSIPGLMSEIKKQLWGGHLWLEGYAVRTAGDVTGAKVEECINRK